MRKTLVLLTLLAIGTPAVLASSHGPLTWAGSYAGPGSIVTSFSFVPGNEAQATFVDNGAVVCEDTNGDGIYDSGRGGTCIPFANMGYDDSIYVVDALENENVAYQVCVDMNGDGVCGIDAANGTIGFCRDAIFFSHSSFTGGFDNPMYVDTPGLASQQAMCGGSGGFQGYVVILCAGAHQTFGDPDGHTHEATIGQVYTTFGASKPHGDYCGSPVAAKAYRVI